MTYHSSVSRDLCVTEDGAAMRLEAGYMYESHASCVTALASFKHTLLSGGSDEHIKCVPVPTCMPRDKRCFQDIRPQAPAGAGHAAHA